MPPPAKQSAPETLRAASEGQPESRKGPKLKANRMRSPGTTPAAWRTSLQSWTMASHDSGVSSHRSGAPVVPARLVAPRVLIEGFSQDASVGRMRRLFGNEVRFARERNALLELGEGTRGSSRRPVRWKTFLVEGLRTAAAHSGATRAMLSGTPWWRAAIGCGDFVKPGPEWWPSRGLDTAAFGRRSRFVQRHQSTAGDGEEDAEIKQRAHFREINFVPEQPKRDQGVHHRGAGEYDGWRPRRASLCAEGEQGPKGANGPMIPAINDQLHPGVGV